MTAVDGHQTFVRDFEIVNQRGLHARASAKFVSLVSGFNALVNVEKDGVTVGGTASSMTLTGTIADINAFVAGGSVSFTNALNATADVDLTPRPTAKAGE